MAAFNVIKKSLETMEQNVSQCKIMLESRVKSLDEMKRKRSEAETDEERRELKTEDVLDDPGSDGQAPLLRPGA